MKQHVLALSMALALVFTLTVSGSALATATLHIGFGAGTECATGCGGDPNVSPQGGSDTFNIFQNSGGATDITSPVWLIIGVPDVQNNDFFDAGSISSVYYYPDYSDPYSGTPASVGWSYGGWQGNLTSDKDSNEVYGDVLGLTPPDFNLNNSNNFVNWHDTDVAANGIDASFFGIYVFYLDTGLGAKGLININMESSSTAPLGSYVIAYGTGSNYGVPFTESGLQIPEPSTLVLLGAGLIGFGGFGLARRRRRG